MRHGFDGRYFGRNTSHRIAMLRNLANSVITEEQVVTTVQKAKEARRVVDRLVTLGKAGSLHDKRLAFDRTRSRDVVLKLFGALAERYKKRAGGYTRVLKLAERRKGDGAELAVLEMVDHPELNRKRKPSLPGKDTAADAKTDAAPQATGATDPYSKFRKLFGGTRKKAKEAKSAAAASPQAAPKAHDHKHDHDHDHDHHHGHDHSHDHGATEKKATKKASPAKKIAVKKSKKG